MHSVRNHDKNVFSLKINIICFGNLRQFPDGVEGRNKTVVEFESYDEINILNITCHPQYNANSLFHDLAVIKLETSVNLSPALVPACLANIESENLYDTLLQTGFGVIKQTSNLKK